MRKPPSQNRRHLVLWAVVVCLCAVTGAAADRAGAPNAKANVAGKVGTETVSDSLRVRAFPRTQYEWPYSSGPSYGELPRALRRAAGALHTPVGTFRLRDVVPLLPEALRSRTPDGPGYFIVQLDPSAAARGALDELLAGVADSFTFRLGDVDRATLGLSEVDELTASFSVALQGNEFHNTTVPQTVILDLDLDSSGGGAPSSYFEGFEVASGLGSLTTMNLDFGMSGVPDETTDGVRCQYSDPDWVNSNSYGNDSATTCGPSANPVQADAFFWQVHQPTEIDSGRSFRGTRSLHYGIFGDAPASGEGVWYLLRLPGAPSSGVPCNASITWDGGGATGRDGVLP